MTIHKNQFNKIKAIFPFQRNFLPKMVLPKYQREANKRFFLNVKQSLQEGGMYVWKDQMATFVKNGNKLYGTKSGLSKVERITDKDFVKECFELLDALRNK